MSNPERVTKEARRSQSRSYPGQTGAAEGSAISIAVAAPVQFEAVHPPQTGQSDGGPLSGPAAPTAFGRWAQRHALLIDSLVMTMLFAYDAMYLTSLFIGFGELSPARYCLAMAVSVMMCVLYVLRRRACRTIPLALLVAAWGYLVLGVGISPGPLVIQALVLYFLGTRFTWRTTVAAALVVDVWIIAATQTLLEKGYLRIGEIGVLVLTAVFVAVLGLFAQARRRHLERLGELNAQLARERDAQATIATAEERARIAREIHDIVSHSLGTMVVMSDGAAQTAQADPGRAGQAMARVRDTGRDAMTEMRRMLGVLKDDGAASRAPQPGMGRLDGLLEQTRATGVRVDLTVSGAPVALLPGVDLAAYRIVQEALTNARKHGGPLLSLITVVISYTDTVLDLRIIDDGAEAGTGSSGGTAQMPRTTGHGLVGMRERASAYGGVVEAGPRAGDGFEVHAVLPIGGAR